MTIFQWCTLILGTMGFIATWTGGVVAITKAVNNIKDYSAEKIAAETEKISERLAEMADRFEQDQKAQDHNFGEVGIAMRQKIADVEKMVREVEIWGRDNYAMKDDVRDILKDIKDMRADIKSDFRDLNTKIDQRQ
jgi:hypothetical protein